MLIFENVRNLKGEKSKLPVMINLFGTRERVADAIGSSVATLALDYIAREVAVPASGGGQSKATGKASGADRRGRRSSSFR